ncbi:sugar nucleotide-binding protein [Teredinibacter haidensis]|mgnify:CR=1 FL=1|uniref:sugar nucleotide-binding protein n=1 Tax=Teredinibacter haidensis TaxID=2731755 RepID=UPI000948CC39|nr:sugar nucleotide-binding protein [Teredinibacter haidensis]
MSYRILVRRADTDLANIFLGVMEDYPFVLLTPSSEGLDWSDPASVEGYFSEKSPSLAIHFPELYGEVSEDDIRAADSMGKACKAKSIPLIQLSSFRVFGDDYLADGIREDDMPAPESDIGRQFLRMEQAALQCPSTIVLRLPWVMDFVSGSLFDRLLPKLMSGNLAPVSDHHRFSLVSAGFVVRSLIALLHQVFSGAENWGVFHLRSSDQCSEAELVDAVVRMLNSEVGLKAAMPQVIGGKDEGRLLMGSANLNGRRCTDDFGIQFPSWRHGFKSLVRRWLHDKNMIAEAPR